MNPQDRAEVIVVGLGAVGSATLYQLARAGVRAIGVDRFHPPHDQGSSHGETRITRSAIGEGEAYVPLAVRSHAIWRELEAETGSSLMLACGFVLIDSSGGTASMHGKGGFAQRTRAAARRFGIPHETLTADELTRRFPAFSPCGGEDIYFEPGGGLLYPERCIAAHLDRAIALGARVLTGETVTAISQDGSGVAVETDASRLTADRVVVAAGGWTPGLIGGPFAKLRLLRQVLHWFQPGSPGPFRPDRFPAFIWTHGPAPEDVLYGLPITPSGTPGVKLATEQYARDMASPEALDRNVSADEVRALWERHVKGRLTGLSPAAVRSAVCFYTSADDGDFVLGTAALSDRVIAASACSGHGFKHSAALGERLAGIAKGTEGVPAAFSAARGALRDRNGEPGA